MKKVTYAKNVFIPLTTVCSNHCTYCRFKEPLKKAEIISLTRIKSILNQAKEAGCKEVLFTCGTQPERIAGFEQKLEQKTGYKDWLSFVTAACQAALDEGLLPHSNLGVIESSKLAKLAEYNASLGLMLETTAKLKAHAQSPTKSLAARREMIAEAGRLKIPFTSGILLGIGESKEDRKDSLELLQELAKEYGHIQEVIIQPVDPPSTSNLTAPKWEVVLNTLKLAKEILPESIALQVPPNLVDLANILSAPVDDLGGISPLTPDYINPKHQWPKMQKLRNRFPKIKFQERLPIYGQYLEQKWVRKEVWNCLKSEGLINEYSTKRNSSES